MAVGTVGGRGLRRGRRPRKLVVPDVSGLLLADAQIVLTQAGFSEGVGRFVQDYATEDTVVSQSPARGQLVDSDAPILLSVAKPSWLQFLPQVFQSSADQPGSQLRELLYIFQQLHETVTSKVDLIPKLLRPLEAPPEYLPWLSSWIALQLESDWPEEKKRRWLRHAPALYNIRGTRRALELLLEIYTGVRPTVIENEWPDEAFRVEVNSTVGETSTILPPMNLNNCFIVELPMQPAEVDDEQLVRIHRVIQAEKPAHTNYFLRFKAPEASEDWGSFWVIGEDTMMGEES